MARLQVHLFASLQKFSLKLGTSEPAYRLLPGTHHLLTTAFQRTLPDVDTRETLSFWISIKTDSNSGKGSLRKQLTFGNANTGFPAKWGLRNECRNSILMTRHYPDLGSASDWLNQISHAAWPIWNFCACFSDVIWRGNQWQHCQMSAVFSGYGKRVFINSMNSFPWLFKC